MIARVLRPELNQIGFALLRALGVLRSFGETYLTRSSLRLGYRSHFFTVLPLSAKKNYFPLYIHVSSEMGPGFRK